MEGDDFTTGAIAGRSCRFRSPHRDSNETPITTAIALTVPVSHEDVEAVLWWMLRDGGLTFEDIADDHDARVFLLESLIGHGTCAVEACRLDLSELTPGDPNYVHLVRLRRRVEDLIGPRPAHASRGRRHPRAPVQRRTSAALAVNG